jgi:hypothetical protein
LIELHEFDLRPDFDVKSHLETFFVALFILSALVSINQRKPQKNTEKPKIFAENCRVFTAKI